MRVTQSNKIAVVLSDTYRINALFFKNAIDYSSLKFSTLKHENDRLPLPVRFLSVFVRQSVLVFVADEHRQALFPASVHEIDHTCDVNLPPP
jgi:hypothetical protein